MKTKLYILAILIILSIWLSKTNFRKPASLISFDQNSTYQNQITISTSNYKKDESELSDEELLRSSQNTKVKTKISESSSMKALARTLKLISEKKGAESTRDLRVGGVRTGYLFGIDDVVFDQIIQGQDYQDIPTNAGLLYTSFILGTFYDSELAGHLNITLYKFNRNLMRETAQNYGIATGHAQAIGLHAGAFIPQYVLLISEKFGYQYLAESTTKSILTRFFSGKAAAKKYAHIFARGVGGFMGTIFSYDISKTIMSKELNATLVLQTEGKENIQAKLNQLYELKNQLKKEKATKEELEEVESLISQYEYILTVGIVVNNDIIANYAQGAVKSLIITGLITLGGLAIERITFRRPNHKDACLANLNNLLYDIIENKNKQEIRYSAAEIGLGLAGSLVGSTQALFEYQDILEQYKNKTEREIKASSP